MLATCTGGSSGFLLSHAACSVRPNLDELVPKPALLEEVLCYWAYTLACHTPIHPVSFFGRIVRYPFITYNSQSTVMDIMPCDIHGSRRNSGQGICGISSAAPRYNSALKCGTRRTYMDEFWVETVTLPFVNITRNELLWMSRRLSCKCTISNSQG